MTLAPVRRDREDAESRRRLAPLAGAGLLLAGILLAVAIGEIVARITWKPPPPRPPPRPLARWTVGRAGFMRLANPNIPIRKHGIEKPRGHFRIVVVGDSVTMGSGVGAAKAYPALLEAELNRAGAQRRYEVLNLGLSGLNIGRIMTRLESVGLRFDPDLIVYGSTLNDIEGPAYHRAPGVGRGQRQPFFARRRQGHQFDRSPSYLLRVLWPRWDSLRELISPRPGSYLHELRENYFNNPEAWADFERGLDRLAEIARARGVCAHLLIHTALSHLNAFHPPRSIYDRIAEAATTRGLTVTQSFPYFRGESEDVLRVSLFDPHPNTAGQRLLARALADGLRGLPPGCWLRPTRTHRSANVRR
jgi:lysophospholipase L1-like esterase